MVDPVKHTVWQYCQTPTQTNYDELIEVTGAQVSEDYVWHGVHPFNELHGAESVVETVWRPLRESIPDLERRDEIFFSGEYDERGWVCAMGHLFGTFTRDWIGSPATGRCIWLRYGEFHRVEDHRIAESYCFFDLPGFTRQAGTPVLPESLGSEILIPGPSTQDGLLFDEHDQERSQETLRLIESMLFDGLMNFDQSHLGSMDMEHYWSPDMMWYGPSGIGTTRGLGGFQAQHQEPFLRGFPDRKGGNHDVRIAEGDYGASAGWPSLGATHLGGGWLGLAPTGKQVTMRVMDVWRREGRYLKENWVFIDLPELLLQMGVDVFERLREYRLDPMSKGS